MAATGGSRSGTCTPGLDRQLQFCQLRRIWFIRAAGLLSALMCLLTIAPEPCILKVVFLGDVMLGRGVEQAAGRDPDWQPFAALSPLLQDADILAANLESPFTSAPVVTKGYILCASPSQADALSKASFDLITLSNNHRLDCGQAGADQTLEVLKAHQITSSDPTTGVTRLDRQGIRLAFLALDDISAPLDPQEIYPVIEAAKSKADVLIVSIHWGIEYNPAPSKRQRALAAAFSQAGADAIIGHHPHVIQPVEVLRRDGSTSSTPVFYSLGNALFDQHGLPDTRTGEAVNLWITRGRILRYETNIFMIDPIKGVIQGLLPEKNP